MMATPTYLCCGACLTVASVPFFFVRSFQVWYMPSPAWYGWIDAASGKERERVVSSKEGRKLTKSRGLNRKKMERVS